MKNFHIKKGHDLRLAGKPEKIFKEIAESAKLSVIPPNFNGIKPKLVIKEGDQVKVGTTIFFDKLHPEVKYTSPGGGKVSRITYGERRRIEEIVIDLDKDEQFEEFQSYKKEQIGDMTADQVRDQLQSSGCWPMIRQRPYSKPADPTIQPKSIFISAMPTVPFAPDIGFLLSEDSKGFHTGLELLTKLTEGKVNLILQKGEKELSLTDAPGVAHYSFSGPHPAGNTGIHIHHIDPIQTGEAVWYISIQDVQAIGRLFLEGKIYTKKVITIGGSGIAEQYYAKVRRGAVVADILKNNKTGNDVRLISGDVLSGTKVTDQQSIGYYDEILSVIPEGRDRKFMDWISLGFDKYSISNTFFSKLTGKKEHVFHTNQNGGKRAIIPFGSWEAMLPMDIMPTFLIKSILARDIEEMEKLGIYECDPEDFALCTFSCISKMEVSQIIRDGLEFIEMEG